MAGVDRVHPSPVSTLDADATSRGQKHIGWILAIIALAAAYYSVPEGTAGFVAWPLLIIFYAVFLRHLRRPTFIKPGLPTFASIEVLFMIFYYGLFLWPYQLAVMGEFDLSQSKYMANTFANEGNRAMVLAMLGLMAFLAGLKWHRSRASLHDAEGPQAEIGRPSPTADTSFYRGLAPILLAMQISLIGLYLALGLRSEGEGRYTGTSSGGSVADGISLLILMVCLVSVALSIALKSVSEVLPVSLVVAAGVAGVWGFRLLVLGDRNAFLLLAVIVIGGLFTFRIKAGRLSLVFLVLAALFLYNAVESARQSRSDPLTSLLGSFDAEARHQNVNPEHAHESSFNITTIGLRATISAVPAVHHYGFGKYKLIGVAGILPMARGLTLPSDLEFTDTSQVLTATMLPPDAGWNVGTNVVSDSYVDFGVAGVILLLYLLGRFGCYTRMRVREAPSSVPAIVLYLLTLALFTELPRYSVDFPIRILVWSAALFGLYRLIFGNRRAHENKSRIN